MYIDDIDKKCIIGTTIFFVFLGILIMPPAILQFKHDSEYRQYYTYTDMDGNTGVAKVCQVSDYRSGNRGGGQGAPVCRLEDGTIVMVKSYKLEEEKR